MRFLALVRWRMERALSLHALEHQHLSLQGCVPGTKQQRLPVVLGGFGVTVAL